MNVILWFLLTAAIVFVWFRVNRKLFKDVLSPFNCLLIGWVGPLLLKTLNLSTLERPWSFELVVLTAWVTFALIVTSLLPALSRGNVQFSSRQHLFAEIIPLMRNGMFRLLLIASFGVGFAGYVYTEFYTNEIGIPLIAYLQDPSLSRSTIPYWQWGKGDRLAILVVPLFVVVPMLYMVARTGRRRVEKLFYLFLAAVYPIGTLLKMSRIDFVNIITSIVFVEYYYRAFLLPEKSSLRQKFVKYWRQLVLAIVVIAVGWILSTTYMNLRTGVTMGSDYMTKRLGIEIDLPEPASSFVVHLYSYVAMPFENFANFYNSYSGGYKPGIGFFRPVLSLIAQGRVADEMLRSVDFNLQLLPVNTYPFITLIYAELGMLGFLVSPIVYGLFVNGLYIRFRRRPNFPNFFVYVICPFAWLWMFSWPVFTVLTFYLYMAYTLVLYRVYLLLRAVGPQKVSVRGYPAPSTWQKV
jgi:oligosaccharide repeat unit polymerase